VHSLVQKNEPARTFGVDCPAKAARRMFSFLSAGVERIATHPNCRLASDKARPRRMAWRHAGPRGAKPEPDRTNQRQREDALLAQKLTVARGTICIGSKASNTFRYARLATRLNIGSPVSQDIFNVNWRNVSPRGRSEGQELRGRAEGQQRAAQGRRSRTPRRWSAGNYSRLLGHSRSHSCKMDIFSSTLKYLTLRKENVSTAPYTHTFQGFKSRGDNSWYPEYKRPLYPVGIRLLGPIENCLFSAIFFKIFTLWPMSIDIWLIFTNIQQIFFDILLKSVCF